MRPPAEIWRQRLWVWLPAAIFFLANIVALAIYRFGYADRVETLKEELGSQRAAVKAGEQERRNLEALLQQATVNRKRIEQLYAENFSTRRRRLTGVTAEVIALAGKAGLSPRSLAYPEQEIQGYGLIKRSFIFAVDGTYLDLRRFINLLELSDSFLTLEGVSLAEGAAGAAAGRRGGPQMPQMPLPPQAVPPLPGGLARGGGAGAGGSELRMGLRLSTLFAKEEVNPADPANPATPAEAARSSRSPR